MTIFEQTEGLSSGKGGDMQNTLQDNIGTVIYTFNWEYFPSTFLSFFPPKC